MGIVAEIKGALGRIEDVASEHLALVRDGHNVKALCPFHTEKTPSFVIYVDAQNYHCFGCGAHGDILDLQAHFDGRHPDSAYIGELADRLGLSRTDDRFSGHKTVLSQVTDIYHSALFGNPEAKAYLKSRGISKETATAWKLGYAAGDLHKSNAASTEILLDLGLIRHGDHGVYDQFRDRLIFPITSRGRVVGFGGRALSPDAKAKYINSVDHPLFHKGDILFGLDRTRITDGTLVMVEGYFDVIGLHQAGFTNTVGIMGTALTEAHIRSLQGRNITRIVLAFDEDKAGIKCTYEAAKTLARLMPEAQVCTISGDTQLGLDPDEIVMRTDAGSGPEFWKFMVDNAPAILEAYVNTYGAKIAPLSAAEKQSALIKMLSYINNFGACVAAEAKQQLALKSGVSSAVLQSLEPAAPQRQAEVAVEAEDKPKIPEIVVNTLQTLDRYVAEVVVVDETPQSMGLAPVGEIDFGKLWGKRGELATMAGSLEDPARTIQASILHVRRMRLRQEPDAGNHSPDMQSEWQRLVHP